MIDILCLAAEDITLPLIHVRGILRTLAATDDSKLSTCLTTSREQAEQIAFIIDQLLAHSHVAAAASLSRGPQRFATAQDSLSTGLPPGLYNSGITAQELHAQGSECHRMIEGMSQKKQCLNHLWTTQSLSKKTPWGTIKAEISLIGDCLHSEILYFHLIFSPDRQLSDTGVIVDYKSHHIKTFVRLNYQPCLPDQQPSNIGEFIDYTAQWYLVQVLVKRSNHAISITNGVLFRLTQVLLYAPHHRSSLVRSDFLEPTRQNECLSLLWWMIEHISDDIKSSSSFIDSLPFLSYEQLHVSHICESIGFQPYPVRFLVGKIGFYFQTLEMYTCGFFGRDPGLKSPWDLTRELFLDTDG